MSDPRIQALAAETARKIKALASRCEADIQSIYQDYRERAALIRAEASVDSLTSSDTDLSPEPHPHQHQMR